MIVEVDIASYFGSRSRARFYEHSVNPEDLRYILWSVGERVRRDHGIFARLRIEREDRTAFLDADGRDIHRPGEWFGWLLDLAREHGWKPTT